MMGAGDHNWLLEQRTYAVKQLAFEPVTPTKAVFWSPLARSSSF